MNENNPETLKNKLHTAINKHMAIMKVGKTEAIKAISVPLDVKSRQLYKWLNAETYPHNADNLIATLDTLINDLENPKPSSSLTFRAIVPKGTIIKMSKDEQGNIIINGPISIDLL